MTTSPLVDGDGSLHLSIRCNGRPMGESERVISVLTSHGLDAMRSATIVLADGDMPGRDFPLSNSKEFAPGAEIEIAAGYEGSLHPIFEGIVVGHRISISGAESPRLALECLDDAIVGREPQTSGVPDLVITYGLDMIEFNAEVGRHSGPRVAAGNSIVHGEVRFQGSAKALVGATIRIVGVGDRLSGEFLVSEVTQRIAAGSWTTTVGFCELVGSGPAS